MTTDEPIAELLSQRKLECELKLNRTESIYMPGKYTHRVFVVVVVFFYLNSFYLPLSDACEIFNMNDWIILVFVKRLLKHFKYFSGPAGEWANDIDAMTLLTRLQQIYFIISMHLKIEQCLLFTLNLNTFQCQWLTDDTICEIILQHLNWTNRNCRNVQRKKYFRFNYSHSASSRLWPKMAKQS